MSNRNWAAGALGVVAGVGIALLFLVWADPRFLYPPYRQAAQTYIQGTRTDDGKRQSVKTVYWGLFTADDTVAQWIAATAAFAGVGVSIWAVRLVRSTLLVNQRATEAAEAAVAITREMGEAQTRAYLTVTGGVAIFGGGTEPAIYLKIKNSGNSPAFNVRAKYQRNNAVFFDANPTGGKGGIEVTDAPVAQLIGAGTENEYTIGVFGKISSPNSDGLNFNLEGILEYQTVFDAKTESIDMDTTFLFMFSGSRAAVTIAKQQGKQLRVPMELMPAFMSGWIVDYRRIVGSAREKERRDRQASA